VLWRKLKLDWSYATGELAIVTVGVLLALALGQWNEDRLARAEEAKYIFRISSDLDKDIRMLTFRLQALEQKADSLARISEQLGGSSAGDNELFLQDVVIGANFGWNQGRANRATYDDLIGSGNLGLIADQEIRLAIADYYKDFEEGNRRIEERETDYPAATYKLIPRATVVREDGVVWERGVNSDLSSAQIHTIIQTIMNSDLASLAVAEANFGRFVHGITISQLELAKNLQMSLQAYKHFEN
jgi:hypothetical protein